MKRLLLRWGLGFKLSADITAVGLILMLAAAEARSQAIQILPNSEPHASMTANQAANAFFSACGRKDWDEAEKFWPMPIPDQFEKTFGGLEILRIGQPFRSPTEVSLFVPYRIRLKNGEIKKFRLALRNDNPAGRWIVDGGL